MTHNTQFLTGNPKRENHGNRDIPLYNLRIQEEIRLQHSSDRVYQPHMALGVCCHTTMAPLTHTHSSSLLHSLYTQYVVFSVTLYDVLP